MAKRPIFISTKPDITSFYQERLVEFTYYSGFAISQKQRSISSLHENAAKDNPSLKILEVSSKSGMALGVQLSAFNLKFFDEATSVYYPLENVFQASKTYEKGGPYYDLLNVPPTAAKRDERHHSSGELKCFTWHDWKCSLEPKTMFYDWIYCKALSVNKTLAEQLLQEGYNAFTDIEFNPKKSINCQARSAAIFVSLCNRGILDEYLSDHAKWQLIYTPTNNNQSIEKQLSFDFKNIR